MWFFYLTFCRLRSHFEASSPESRSPERLPPWPNSCLIRSGVAASWWMNPPASVAPEIRSPQPKKSKQRRRGRWRNRKNDSGLVVSGSLLFVFWTLLGSWCLFFPEGIVVSKFLGILYNPKNAMMIPTAGDSSSPWKGDSPSDRRLLRWKQVQEFLLDHEFADSSDVNAAKTTWWGFSRTYPLHVAAKEGNFQIMNLLMKFGADPKQRDGRGKTAIMYSASILSKLSDGSASGTLG